ncbi:glutathione S-transferase N-terminal domain-containing protein [Aliamphritea spongicola]|nr:glutathione S-transferase N-terminal domain-containing protein [Aliamphritea spongicola]
MKLFYKPGACSLASHIILREAGADFELEAVDTDRGRTASDHDYREVNPKGYVPALQLASGDVLTEGAVVLQFIADRFAPGQLIPAPEPSNG